MSTIVEYSEIYLTKYQVLQILQSWASSCNHFRNLLLIYTFTKILIYFYNSLIFWNLFNTFQERNTQVLDGTTVKNRSNNNCKWLNFIIYGIYLQFISDIFISYIVKFLQPLVSLKNVISALRNIILLLEHKELSFICYSFSFLVLWILPHIPRKFNNFIYIFVFQILYKSSTQLCKIWNLFYSSIL